MSQFEAIDDEVLSTVGGGVSSSLVPTGPGGPRQPRERDEEGGGRRTWGQVGREYGAACAQGAAQNLMFGGMGSRSDAVRSGLMGCALGVGMKAIEDITGVMSG